MPKSIIKLSNRFSGADVATSQIPEKSPQFLVKRSSIFSRDTLMHPEDAIQWCLRSIDDEQFDFFPRSFLWYQLFLVYLLSLIIFRFLQLLHNNELIDGSYNKYHNTLTLSFSKSNESSSILDWIIIYSILILMNWEALFVFYRYYSTIYTAKYFDTINTKTIFKVFFRYSISFVLLFIAQIHVFFWLFPIIIILSSIFVIFCTWKTSNILIAQFKQMDLMMSSFGSNASIKDAMSESIYFIRNSSMISSICCIIYLSLFLIIYNIHILFYLPIIWCIISISFTLNFIRNRHFVIHIFTRLFYPKKLKLSQVKSRSLAVGMESNLPNTNTNTNAFTTVAAMSPTVTCNNKMTIDIANNNNNNDITNMNTMNNANVNQLQIPYDNNSNNNNNNIQNNIASDTNNISTNMSYPNNNITNPTHPENTSKTITLTMTKTAIIHSLEQKVSGPEFGLDILYDINGEEIICDDEDEIDGMVNIQEIPFEFIHEDNNVFSSNCITREPSPMNSPRATTMLNKNSTSNHNSNRFNNFNSNQNSNNVPRRIHFTEASAASPSNSIQIMYKKSNSIKKKKSKIHPKMSNSLNKKSNSKNKTAKDYTAAISRIDSDRKRKILKVRDKWRNKFKAFRSKSREESEVNNAACANTSAQFGKSQSTKSKFKEVRFIDPNYLQPNATHRRIKSDKPSIHAQQARSNPFPVFHSPSVSTNTDNYNVPQITTNYSDPVHIKRSKNVLTPKESNHILSLSFQPGEVQKLEDKIKRNKKHKRSSRSISRKLIFNRLPTEIRELPEVEKKKVEEFANLHLCMSLHGFCQKNTLFQFAMFETESPN